MYLTTSPVGPDGGRFLLVGCRFAPQADRVWRSGGRVTFAAVRFGLAGRFGAREAELQTAAVDGMTYSYSCSSSARQADIWSLRVRSNGSVVRHSGGLHHGAAPSGDGVHGSQAGSGRLTHLSHHDLVVERGRGDGALEPDHRVDRPPLPIRTRPSAGSIRYSWSNGIPDRASHPLDRALVRGLNHPPGRELRPDWGGRWTVWGGRQVGRAVKPRISVRALRRTGHPIVRSSSRTTVMTPRPIHPSSPVSTASSAASVAVSPRSDPRERHRRQERGQRRFCAPHFLHIAMMVILPATVLMKPPGPPVRQAVSSAALMAAPVSPCSRAEFCFTPEGDGATTGSMSVYDLASRAGGGGAPRSPSESPAIRGTERERVDLGSDGDTAERQRTGKSREEQRARGG